MLANACLQHASLGKGGRAVLMDVTKGIDRRLMVGVGPGLLRRKESFEEVGRAGHHRVVDHMRQLGVEEFRLPTETRHHHGVPQRGRLEGPQPPAFGMTQRRVTMAVHMQVHDTRTGVVSRQQSNGRARVVFPTKPC